MRITRPGTPDTWARWLIAQVFAPRPILLRPAAAQARIVREAQTFTMRREAYGATADLSPGPALVGAAVAWAGEILRSATENGAVVEVSKWTGLLRERHGRMEAVALAESPWIDAFRWNVFHTLSTARVRFCRRHECQRPYVARKGQLYCKPSHAVRRSERSRAYWQRQGDKINERRRAAYAAKMKRLTGGTVNLNRTKGGK